MLLTDGMFHHFFVSKSDSYLIPAFGASGVRSYLVQLLNLLLYLMISLGVIFFFFFFSTVKLDPMTFQTVSTVSKPVVFLFCFLRSSYPLLRQTALNSTELFAFHG